MRTRTYVTPSAEITQVVDLQPGDVYARIEPASAYRDTARMAYGIVQNVMQSGGRTAVTALEVGIEFSSTTVTRKVFDGDQELHLFPATAADVRTHIAEIREQLDREVSTAEKALQAAQRKRDDVLAVLSTASTLRDTKVGAVTAEAPAALTAVADPDEAF